jgi:NAD(P)-dependent dehydrogenase (short-subunit alcohol dehydrogenase family)
MSILRDNLLAGRIVATNAAGELREALEALGAEVVDAGGAGGAEPGSALDALVHDARADFGGGGPDALLTALEALWAAIANAANASLIPSGDGGKVVLIAPEGGAGAYADAAQAAIDNLARTLSTEWARYGITATAVTPRGGTRESDLAVLVAFIVSGAGDYYSGARFELGGR